MTPRPCTRGGGTSAANRAMSFASRAEWHDILAAAGFMVDDTTAFGGYTAPHALFTARAGARRF